jgi:hypothetical protein
LQVALKVGSFFFVLKDDQKNLWMISENRRENNRIKSSGKSFDANVGWIGRTDPCSHGLDETICLVHAYKITCLQIAPGSAAKI